MPETFKFLTLDQAVSALQGRLQSTTLWTTSELTGYLTEALRFWNALTESYKITFVFQPASIWVNLGTLAGSPRLRTVTDVNLYTSMENMLMEPPTGGTWTGTNQFDIPSLEFALSKRRNEAIQAASCNLGLTTLPITPGTRSATLPDTVLEPFRMRFIPAQGFGDPIWLSREDIGAFNYWEPNYNQTEATPNAWDVISQTPLTIGVDNAPNVPGTLEFVTLNSGPDFAPPAATLLGLPDDWSWLPMYGALADLLEGEPERTDRAKASYCKQRFDQGLQIVRHANWLIDASTGNGPCDVLSLARADQYDTGWDAAASDGGFSKCVVAGMDFAAFPNTASSNLTLVSNQPIPANGGDFLQISRDVADVIIDEAQHLACFKLPSGAFQQTMPLHQGFMKAATETNKRLEQLGINFKELSEVGRIEQMDVPRS